MHESQIISTNSAYWEVLPQDLGDLAEDLLMLLWAKNNYLLGNFVNTGGQTGGE